MTLISRRGFLGSVLGTWLGGELVAALPSEPQQLPGLDWLRLVQDIGGLDVQACGVRSVERVGPHSWRVTAHELHATRTLVARGVTLCLPDGTPLLPKQVWDSPVHLVSGDTLLVAYKLNIECGARDLEEVVRRIAVGELSFSQRSPTGLMVGHKRR